MAQAHLVVQWSLSNLSSMRGLRITLDKSVVYGLHNEEVDSLDRYFFQVVPSILVNEILADLTEETDPRIPGRIAAHAYRVSGNHGLTLDYRKRLANSLLGREIPMDGRFLASNETVVKTASGSLAIIVETPLEDEILARWERRDFTDEERFWAQRFRQRMERPLNPKLYLDNIAKAGLSFDIPRSDEELFKSVNDLLSNRSMLPRLFTILARDFGVPYHSSDEITKRWYKEGRKPFEEFAPYAFFCLKANFLWHLSLTNSELFKPDKNDRKDLEYCYYLPNAQVFATRDKKLLRLTAALIRSDQSLVSGDELKRDLHKINDDWNGLGNEERIALNAERGSAPPEDPNSIVYQLWKKHNGKINPSRHREIVDRNLVDASLPKQAQVPFTFAEFAQKKAKEIREGKKLSERELEALNQYYEGRDPTTMRMFNSRIKRERLRKWHPELTDDDVDKLTSETQNQIWLDPYEYRNIQFYD
jgi:hypothetical protein